MVKVSTLFYLLENQEYQVDEVISSEEINEMEDNYLNGLFRLIDGNVNDVNPNIIENILKAASTE